MPNLTVEERLIYLEEQMRDIIARVPPSSAKDWRSSLGMFDDRPVMREIDEEGRRIREADRESSRGDHS